MTDKPTAAPTPAPKPDKCGADQVDNCKELKDKMYCEVQADWMAINCCKTCAGSK